MAWKFGSRGHCSQKKSNALKYKRTHHIKKSPHKVKSCGTKAHHKGKRRGCKYGRRKGSKRCRKHRKK